MAIRRARRPAASPARTRCSTTSRCPSDPPGGIISIRYDIDSLPLLAGGYIVQVSAHDVADSVMYDFSDPAASFHIDNSGGHVGLLEMHGDWQVEREADVPAGSAAGQTAR